MIVFVRMSVELLFATFSFSERIRNRNESKAFTCVRELEGKTKQTNKNVFNRVDIQEDKRDQNFNFKSDAPERISVITVDAAEIPNRLSFYPSGGKQPCCSNRAMLSFFNAQANLIFT